MAKQPTVTTITSGYASNTQLNANFVALRDAFSNTLSLDGSTPNTLTADLDLGTQDLLNVGNINGTSASGLSANLDVVAGISGNIATVAGISADVTQVAADTVVINAASANASAAAASAGAASTSETNAAASEAAAAASYDSFDDRYLGAKASNPTVDNDGDPLITGALYFNTTSDEMRTWNGSAWVASFVTLAGALLANNNLSDLDNAATALTNLGITSTAAELNILDGVTASTAEINHLVGVTSLIQTQLDAKSTASATETLTNKTITAPTISAPAINGAVSGDSLSTQAEAEAGTNNDQLMTPLRTAQAITALGGVTELISNTVISSGASEVVFTGLSNSLYSKYLFVFSYVLPTTNNRQFLANLSDNNGSTWDTAYYEVNNSSTVGDIFLTDGTLSGDTLVGNVGAEAGYVGQVELYLSSSNSRRTYATYKGAYWDGSSTPEFKVWDSASSSTVFKNYNAIKFFYSGTLLSGTVSMYGVKKS